MHNLEKRVQHIILANNLILPEETVVVGVSGGPDSIALLHILAVLAGPIEFRIKVVYVDHGLRPRETPREVALVRESAQKLGFSCKVVKADVYDRVKRDKLSLEHAGRLMRYEIFSEVAGKYAAWKIAVGHTSDDQAEELLLRLIRGTARKGLSGMEKMTGRKVIRPLLDVPKADLIDYLADKKISFLEDSSNRDRRFLRNKVRLDLLPFLENNFYAGVKETLRRTAKVLAAEESYLDEVAKDASKRLMPFQSRVQAEELDVPCKGLLNEHVAIQRRLIEQILLNLGAQPAGRQIDNILRLALKGHEGGILHLTGGLRIAKEGGALHFTYPLGRSAFRGDPAKKDIPQFNFRADGPGVYPIPGIGLEISLEVFDSLPTKEELARFDAEYLDSALSPFPLIVRSPCSGDRLQPLGAPGSKKLSDIYIDRKVPRKLRHGPVLFSGEDIVAVPGLVVAHGVRITNRTVKVLVVSINVKK